MSAPKLTREQLERMQAETGIDVFAMLDNLRRTPAERLRIATENARNLAKLREATRRTRK